tara:strand:- start:118287 stop:118946 length:660 start_codon:yes stop_codon:yes gene_type:complete
MGYPFFVSGSENTLWLPSAIYPFGLQEIARSNSSVPSMLSIPRRQCAGLRKCRNYNQKDISMSDRINADPAALAAAIYNRMSQKLKEVPDAAHETPGYRSAQNGSRVQQTGQPLPQRYQGDRTIGLVKAGPFARGVGSNRIPPQTDDTADAKQKVLAALMATGISDQTHGQNAQAVRHQVPNRHNDAQTKMASNENPFLTGGQQAVLQALLERQTRQIS